MSSVNLVLGVGGTGAKVVESLLVSTLAGFGPDDLRVAFVDQDGGNGNVARSLQLLLLMERFRGLWWTGSRPDTLKPDSGRGLGSAQVRRLSDAEPLWCPHPAGATLADIFNADAVSREEPELRALMDSLFAPDRTEQRMDLSVGYRGRAHIGSAAFLSRAEESDPFWSAIVDTLKRGQGGQEVRIFLAGSVFGGTGAAGFPTLARRLRRLARELDGARVRIGGALMLPYFGFNRPDDPEANVARQEDLLLQSEEALRYYGELFEREGGTFDELYLTGWNPYFQLGYHSSGTSSQANPPLPPELIAATGAVRFFTGEHGAGERNNVFISSRKTVEALGWGDLPGPFASNGATAYQSLGRLLRFCTVWRNTLRPALKPRMFGGDPWYRKQEAGKVKYNDPQTIENLQVLDELVGAVLQWAAGMQLFATTRQFGPAGVRGFELWDVSADAHFPDDLRPEQVSQPIRLRDALPEDRAVAAYDRLVWQLDQDHRPLPQSALFNELNERSRPGDHQGLGRLVDAAFAAAAVQPEPPR